MRGATRFVPLLGLVGVARHSSSCGVGTLARHQARNQTNWDVSNYAAAFLYFVVLINITLGVFNLIPIPPLDGSRVAQLLPGEVGEFFVRMERERWGFGILFLLLALPFITGGQIDIIGAIVDPIRGRFLDLFLNG